MGKVIFIYKESVEIKKKAFPDKTLDYLFETEEKEVLSMLTSVAGLPEIESTN